MLNHLRVNSLNAPVRLFRGWHIGSLEEVATEELQGAIPMRAAVKDLPHLSMLFHQFPRDVKALAYVCIPEGIDFLDDETPVTFAGASWEWIPIRRPLLKPSDQRTLPLRPTPLWGGNVGMAPLGQVLDEFGERTARKNRLVVVDKDARRMRGYMFHRADTFGHVQRLYERGPAWYVFSTNPIDDGLRAQLDPSRLREAFRRMVHVPRNCNSLGYLTLDDGVENSRALNPEVPATLSYGRFQRDDEEDIRKWNLSWTGTLKGNVGDLLAWYESAMAPPRGLVTDAPYWAAVRYIRGAFEVSTTDPFRTYRRNLARLKRGDDFIGLGEEATPLS